MYVTWVTTVQLNNHNSMSLPYISNLNHIETVAT